VYVVNDTHVVNDFKRMPLLFILEKMIGGGNVNNLT
jgi:hypothetical protein